MCCLTSNTITFVINFRLPEVPVDTEESNAVMRSYKEYPEYQKIKPSTIIAGTCKYAILADVALGKHIIKLSGKKGFLNQRVKSFR